MAGGSRATQRGEKDSEWFIVRSRRFENVIVHCVVEELVVTRCEIVEVEVIHTVPIRDGFSFPVIPAHFLPNKTLEQTAFRPVYPSWTLPSKVEPLTHPVNPNVARPTLCLPDLICDREAHGWGRPCPSLFPTYDNALRRNRETTSLLEDLAANLVAGSSGDSEMGPEVDEWIERAASGQVGMAG